MPTAPDAAILNVEEDHLDIYHNLEGVIKASQTSPSRMLNREGVADRPRRSRRRAVTRSTKASQKPLDSPAKQAGRSHSTWGSGSPRSRSQLHCATSCPAKLSQCGRRRSALWAGTGPILVQEAMTQFTGLARRTEFVGTKTLDSGPVRVWDDYGHHPTEIDRTLRALRASESPRRLVCVFQPHHSRTRFLLDEFNVFVQRRPMWSLCLRFILFVIPNPSRLGEPAHSGERLQARGTNALAADSLEDTVSRLDGVLCGGDLLVVMGARP